MVDNSLEFAQGSVISRTVCFEQLNPFYTLQLLWSTMMTKYDFRTFLGEITAAYIDWLLITGSLQTVIISSMNYYWTSPQLKITMNLRWWTQHLKKFKDPGLEMVYREATTCRRGQIIGYFSLVTLAHFLISVYEVGMSEKYVGVLILSEFIKSPLFSLPWKKTSFRIHIFIRFCACLNTAVGSTFPYTLGNCLQKCAYWGRSNAECTYYENKCEEK